jgi:hypothetical protein
MIGVWSLVRGSIQETIVSLISVPWLQCFEQVWVQHFRELMTCPASKPWSMVHRTNSCQFSPARHSIHTSSEFSSIIFFYLSVNMKHKSIDIFVIICCFHLSKMNFLAVWYSFKTVDKSWGWTAINCAAFTSSQNYCIFLMKSCFMSMKIGAFLVRILKIKSKH